MISSLRVQNLRSYKDKLFEFNDQANIIVGPNASGKTNLLEALLVSRVGSSYRVKDTDLISFNKAWARIESLDAETTRVVRLQRDDKPAKTFDINDKVYQRLPANLRLPVVLFEPNHMQLLNGSPEGRRDYLDGFITQLDAEYGPLSRKYLRTLSQRNALLKNQDRSAANQLFPWNIRLSQLAGQIVKYRKRVVDVINEVLPDIYRSLSKDKVTTTIKYAAQLPVGDYESQYLSKLEDNQDEDLRIGFTQYGPHRDDFTFLFNKHPSNTYASRGELRTAVLALKITELKTIKTKTNHSPITLLDDVYSELDNRRRQSLTTYLKDTQSFITTTDADLILKKLASKSKVIKL